MSEREYSEEDKEGRGAGKPVVIPKDAPPGYTREPAWVPGIIEVIFKQPIPPERLLEAANPHLTAQPSDLAYLAALSSILQRYELKDATFSFDSLENVEPLDDQDTSGDEAIEYGRENYVTLAFPDDKDVVQIAQELNQTEQVESALPVPVAVPPSTPKNEPYLGEHTDIAVPNPLSGYENQWYIFRCNADLAWEMGASGTGVVIADIDSGFRVTHQDLEPNIELTYNSFDKSDNVCQGEAKSHGTGVLGLAGAADNDKGMIGFAFGASLWAIQANTGQGPAPLRDPWARAIDFVRKTNSGGRRKVIILEVQTYRLRNYEMVRTVNRAIKDAIAAGVVVCVTAGNGNCDVSIDDLDHKIPYTGSILVGATQHDPPKNTRIYYSNHGERVVVSAPGDQSDVTCSSDSDDDYTMGLGGTSGATPKVAGAIALMLEKNPTLSHRDVRNILMTTGNDVLTGDPSIKAGKFLDVEAVVAKAISRARRPLLHRLGSAFFRLLTRRAA